MADIARTSESLKSLRIGEIEREILDLESLWNQDLLDEICLPESLKQSIADDRYLIPQLKSAIKVCKLWTKQDTSQDSKGFWNIFRDDNLCPSALLVLLCHFLDSADRHLSGVHQRVAAALASRLYFTILQIPGSGAFHILHPILFEKTLTVFKLWPDNVAGKRKRKDSPVASSQGHGKRHQRDKTQHLDEEAVDDDSDSDEDDVMVTLTCSENNKVKSCLVSTLQEFVTLLENYSLKQSEHCYQLCLQTLTDLTRVEPHAHQIEFTAERRMMTTAELAFQGLTSLCTPAHGEVATNVRLVFKHLMPSILMLIGENEGVAAATIPKDVQTIKTNAVSYVCYIISKLGEVAYVSCRVLLQHLCVKVPDKTEYRPRIAVAVTTILAVLPSSFNAKFMHWLHKYSKNVKIGFRVFAVEVVSAMLDDPHRSSQREETDYDMQQVVSHQFLLQMLIGRCSDKAPTVRAKALTCFAVLTSSGNPSILQVLNELFHKTDNPTNKVTPANLQVVEQGTESNPEEENNLNLPQTEVAKDGATPGNLLGGSPAMLLELSTNASMHDGLSMVSMLRHRVTDMKVGVRKAAIQALSNIIALDETFVKNSDIEVLHNHCMDPALSVRKQALNSVTTLLLHRPQHPVHQRMWLNAVLPMVTDREVTAQERALHILEEVILGNMTMLKRSTQISHALAWSLLSIVAGEEGYTVRKYFQKACSLWALQKKLNKKLIDALISHIDSHNREAAWMLLSYTSMCTDNVDSDFVIQCWHRYTVPGEEVTIQTLCCVVTVMGNMAKQLDRATSEDLVDELSIKLQRFNAPTELIIDYVRTIYKLCSTRSNSVTDVQTAIATVCSNILKLCEQYLSRVVLTEDQSQAMWDEEALVKYLFTLGEVAQLCPNHVSSHLFMLVQSLLAGNGAESLPSTQQCSHDSQAPLSQFCGSKMSNKVRAYAFVTLGKLCLQHESLAKQSIAAIARELETAPDTATRNNVVIVLCDLCKRYPNLVDCYIPNIAACLKDDSPLIRKQTLTLLTHLLLEDFIKWRGSLFFRFIVTVVDDIQEIKDFAQLCFKQLLLPRHPNLLFQHFVECIYHFNTYEKHNVYNQFSQSDREKQMFSLQGKENHEKRMQLYIFMLENLKDEHRFQIVAKLTQEILAAIVDGILPLDQHTSVVLQDTLTIMSSKEIKLSSLRSKLIDEPADEMEMAGAVMQQAKTKLITQVVKKNVIENIVPIIISLKHQLEKHRSPVLKYLMMYLKELMKDYRNEVKDIMSADHQLASEIEFDLRKFEEQQQEMKQLEEELRKQAINHEQSVAVASPLRNPPLSPQCIPVVNSPVHRDSPSRAGKSAQTQVTITPSMVANLSPRVVLRPLVRLNEQQGQRSAALNHNSLAVMAIVNSAKKMLASVKRTQPPAKASETVAMETNKENNKVKTPTPHVSTNRNSLFKSPYPGVDGKQSSRAISTPDQTIHSITFMEPMDVSAIPASPIPTSMPIRLYADVDPKEVPGTPSWTPQLQSDDGKPTDVLVMFSPEQPAPKPRQWNIESSSQSAGKKKIRICRPPDDQLCQDDLSRRPKRRSKSQEHQPRRKSSRTRRK